MSLGIFDYSYKKRKESILVIKWQEDRLTFKKKFNLRQEIRSVGCRCFDTMKFDINSAVSAEALIHAAHFSLGWGRGGGV